MTDDKIRLNKDQIKQFCEKNHIKKFAYFGSVLRDDFKSDSDVDILVDLEPDALIGLLEMAQMEIELSKMIGRKVDLRTPEDLSVYFRDKVVKEADIQYERI
ncbi:MAG: nucleotidyltransferase family protein [Candidatus Poribacteria bacterium]